MKNKQRIRIQFRDAVFERDNVQCVMCAAPGVDAHHITDRHEMPNGGYVKENGITLCESCHLKAEQFHISAGKHWEEGFHPDALYEKIDSSYDKAMQASEALTVRVL